MRSDASIGGGSLDHDTVGGDLLAGPDDEAVADVHVVDRDLALGALDVNHRRGLRAHVEQRAESRGGLMLGSRLGVAAREHQHDDDGGDLEVEVVLAPAQ